MNGGARRCSTTAERLTKPPNLEVDDMADQDDTAKPTRGRRNQTKRTAETRASGAAWNSPSLPLPPPQTLEEALARVRALLLDVRSMLHCLSEVLQYSDDNDGVMHAEVAEAAARWVNDSAADLDPVKLQPLIEALRKRDDEPGPGNSGPFQVREPMAVYRAA
jgi:hypothetical protein